MQITVNAPGARTIRDARPMIVDGQRVYVTLDTDGTASLHIGGRIVATKQVASISTREAQDWAVEYQAAANDWAEQQAQAAQDHQAAAADLSQPSEDTTAAVLETILSLDGEYTARAQDENYQWTKIQTLSASRVAASVRQVRDHGGAAIIRDYADGSGWYVQIGPADMKCSWGQYRFAGH